VGLTGSSRTASPGCTARCQSGFDSPWPLALCSARPCPFEQNTDVASLSIDGLINATFASSLWQVTLQRIENDITCNLDRKVATYPK
jgi:hypothetical protein